VSLETYTPEEAAARLQCRVNTLRRWDHNPKIGEAIVGSIDADGKQTRRYRRDVIDEMLAHPGQGNIKFRTQVMLAIQKAVRLGKQIPEIRFGKG
jgi:hypothetical protein